MSGGLLIMYNKKRATTMATASLLMVLLLRFQNNNGVNSFTPPHRHILPAQPKKRIIRSPTTRIQVPPAPAASAFLLFGWVPIPDSDEWEWQEDDPNYVVPATRQQLEIASTSDDGGGDGVTLAKASATPQLPSGLYRPKQSLGQNYLKDPNTVAKILRAFHQDAIKGMKSENSDDGEMTDFKIVELGPGAGALTDKLVETYGTNALQCIEIDDRSIALLHDKYPDLRIDHADVLQVDYPSMAQAQAQGGGEPLVVVGNLPYYITSQILFALADASHAGAVRCATVTMQWEVGQRMVAPTRTKDYGILSVVFQLYADVKCHFKIPPTVFYPKPKVDSALIGLHFLGPDRLRKRLAGVEPIHLRRVVTACFQQRRKTVRNSLKKLVTSQIFPGDRQATQDLLNGPPLPLPASIQQARDDDPSDADYDFFATQELPSDWASKRPEELTPGQFVELTRLLYGPADGLVDEEEDSNLGHKVWRKLKHGSNNN